MTEDDLIFILRLLFGRGRVSCLFWIITTICVPICVLSLLLYSTGKVDLPEIRRNIEQWFEQNIDVDFNSSNSGPQVARGSTCPLTGDYLRTMPHATELYLRSGKGTQNAILAKLDANRCYVLLEVESGWAHIETNDVGDGWVSINPSWIELHISSETYYTNAPANARSCPRLNCRVDFSLSEDINIHVIGWEIGEFTIGSDKWAKIERNGEIFYIHSTLVSPVIFEANNLSPN